TLFWLTCPALRRAVGRMEAAGWIERLAEGQRGARAEQMSRAHATYAALRGRLALALGLWPDHAKLLRVLTMSGVGGATWRDRRALPGLKCLHAHFADFLARGAINPVGEAVAEALSAQGEFVAGGCSLD
ncbi:MAG TPA: DUF501 domain-containing protein, partial [Limnochordia bacterium]